MHIDAIEEGDKVLVFDDLLATGGTAKAACNLVEKAGGVVEGVAFVIELTGSLHGRDQLKGYEVLSLVEIPVEE
jgi:adenine phosphoribosyltransferase